jgi:hypothetical protein
VGDVNGDGYDDVIAGAPWDLEYCTFGIDYLWYGGSRGVRPATWTQFDGSDYVYDSYNFARYTASASDFDGDGIDDLAFGGSYVHVFYGVTSGWGTGDDTVEYPDVYIAGHDPYGQAMPVWAAGDVNGDGFSDLLVHRQPGSSTEAFEVYYGG